MLAVHALVAGYQDTEVLHGVDIELPRGSVTALLGVNGAGKTTFCAALAGLVGANSGTVELLGKDATTAKPYRRARSGLLLAPESRGIFPGLTVDENLQVWLASRSEREEAYTRFPSLASRRLVTAGSLSGGEQQILALAPLLLRRPEVLIVDEPTLGLAPLIVDTVFEMFRQLRDEGVTLLLVEEKVRNVMAIADHVTYLELGHVRWSLPRAEVDAKVLSDSYLGAASATTAP